MKTTNLDTVFVSTPINSTATKVVSQHGEHYEPKINFGSYEHFETPPPMIPIEKLYNKKAEQDARIIIGARSGRLTVVGYAADQNPKKNARWVVRCDCGDFEYRRAKTMLNPLNTADKCRKCTHFEEVKRRYKKP